MEMDWNAMYSVIVFISGLVLYLTLKIPQLRKQAKLGLLLTAYVRDISALLFNKLLHDWFRLSIPDKLDRLKALYDLIESFETMQVNDKTDVNELNKLINDINKGDKI